MDVEIKNPTIESKMYRIVNKKTSKAKTQNNFQARTKLTNAKKN